MVGSVTLTFTVAHVVMSACPPGLPSARAQTVHVVETSTGSWKSAPLLSVALASSTRKLSLSGAGSKKILLTLLRSLRKVPLMPVRPPAGSPPMSWTKIRCPSLFVIAAVLSFGTPMILRL
ncbi:MAG: hypothetical protein AUH67_00310 [Chloroflexi bacterium 13_1_40CM_4_69_19]|nr:MAG: hypothetical protein AUH67_00310 [Chloroflexi bacterium 13_1_40CM_4_69_19]